MPCGKCYRFAAITITLLNIVWSLVLKSTLKSDSVAGNLILVAISIDLYPNYNRTDLNRSIICVDYGHLGNEDCRGLVTTYLEYLVETDSSSTLSLRFTIFTRIYVRSLHQSQSQLSVPDFKGRQDLDSLILNFKIVQKNSALTPIFDLLAGNISSNIPIVAVVFGSISESHLSLILHLVHRLHVITTADSLDLCHKIAAISVSCCTFETFSHCFPLVADIAVLLIDENIPPRPTNSSSLACAMCIKLGNCAGDLVPLCCMDYGIRSTRRHVLVLSSLGADDTSARLPHSIIPKLHTIDLSPTNVDFPLVLYANTSEHTLLFANTIGDFPYEAKSVTDTRNAAEKSTESSLRDLLHGSNSSPRSFTTSAASFSFNYGLNIATLSNVCLENKTSILLFRYSSDPPLITENLKRRLSSSSSGFFTSDPRRSGWVFREVEVSSPGGGRAHAHPFHRHLWLAGFSCAMSPPYSRSIFHSSQVLLGLVHAALNIGHYDWVTRLRRVLMPTVTRDDYEWTLSLTTLVLHFVAKHSHISVPTAYLEEDVQEVVSRIRGKGSDVPLICFDELVVVGAMELSLPFLNSHDEAWAFRTFVYDYYGLSEPQHGFCHIGFGSDSADDTTHTCSSTIFNTNKLNIDEESRRYSQSPDRSQSTQYDQEMSTDSSKRRCDFSQLTPNHALRITILYRPKNRIILNLAEVVTRIELMGVADVQWLRSHVLQLDGMSLRQQVQLMRDTDVLIAPHGAALQNLMFLEAHSAVIEVFTSPWYEPGYQCTALGIPLFYYSLPLTDLRRVEDCAFPADCLATPLLVHRRDLRCYGIRQCSAYVDVDALEVQLWLAVQAVRIRKRQLTERRQLATNLCHNVDGADDGDDFDAQCWYRKPYVNPLIPLQ